jgi:hypothetical protein
MIDGNAVCIMETCDFPYELKIPIETSKLNGYRIFITQTFSGMQKANVSVFN